MDQVKSYVNYVRVLSEFDEPAMEIDFTLLRHQEITDPKIVQENHGQGLSVRINGAEHRYVAEDVDTETMLSKVMRLQESGDASVALGWLRDNAFLYYNEVASLGADTFRKATDLGESYDRAGKIIILESGPGIILYEVGDTTVVLDSQDKIVELLLPDSEPKFDAKDITSRIVQEIKKKYAQAQIRTKQNAKGIYTIDITVDRKWGEIELNPYSGYMEGRARYYDIPSHRVTDQRDAIRIIPSIIKYFERAAELQPWNPDSRRSSALNL